MSRNDLETKINTALGTLWESLARVISTVVSKAILDLEAELKKGKGKVAKECGLLHPNRSIEVTEVQKNVWKDVFPQADFPTSSQASSAPRNSMSSLS